MIDSKIDWLIEARQIDKLVRASMQRLGIPMINTKSFDELVASGELKATECYVLSRDMVDPDWLERANSGSGDKS